MRARRFKTIYRYSNKRIEKHSITMECDVQFEVSYHCGDLWRCRTHKDFYGYPHMKEAKAEEVQTTITEIHSLQDWLKKLRNE